MRMVSVKARSIASNIKIELICSKLEPVPCKSMFCSSIHPSKPEDRVDVDLCDRESPIRKVTCTEFLADLDVKLIIEDQRFMLKHGYTSPLPTPYNSKKEAYSMILKYVEFKGFALYFKQKGQVYVTYTFTSDIIHVSKHQFKGYYERI